MLALAQVSGVVRERDAEEPDRDRVQLDGGHVARPEIERGEDLVAARGPDDRDARRRGEHVEGVGASVALVVREGGDVAVEAEEERAEQAVVQEEPSLVPLEERGGDVDAEDRAPAREEHVRAAGLLRAHVLRTVRDRIGKAVGEGRAGREDQGEGDERQARPARFSPEDPRECEEDTGQEHRAGRREDEEERHADRAAETGAEEIDRIEAGEALGMARENRGDGQPRREERCEEGETEEAELGALDQRDARLPLHQARDQAERVQLDGRDAEVAHEDSSGRDEGADGDEAGHRHALRSSEEHDEHARRAEPEECDADDEVGEVVDELEGEDARVAHLEENDREGEEEELGGERGAAHGRWGGTAARQPTGTGRRGRRRGRSSGPSWHTARRADCSSMDPTLGVPPRPEQVASAKGSS